MLMAPDDARETERRVQSAEKEKKERCEKLDVEDDGRESESVFFLFFSQPRLSRCLSLVFFQNDYKFEGF